MKAWVLFVAVSAMLLPGGAQAQGKPPAFTFMGDSTAIRTQRSTVAGTPCARHGRVLECGPSGRIDWLGERLNFVALTYYDGRLIRAVGAFDRVRHTRVKALLVKAYGKPRAEGYQTMAERPDAFTYPETEWEFDDGKLELESLTDDSPVLTFRFSVRNPPDIAGVARTR